MRVPEELKEAASFVSQNVLYKWQVWGAGLRESDKGWRERWLTWKVNVCSIKMLMDWAGLSSVCVWGREKEEKMFYAIVFAHVPSSVCTYTSKSMNMHVCVHTGTNVLSQ